MVTTGAYLKTVRTTSVIMMTDMMIGATVAKARALIIATALKLISKTRNLTRTTTSFEKYEFTTMFIVNSWGREKSKRERGEFIDEREIFLLVFASVRDNLVVVLCLVGEFGIEIVPVYCVIRDNDTIGLCLVGE